MDYFKEHIGLSNAKKQKNHFISYYSGMKGEYSPWVVPQVLQAGWCIYAREQSYKSFD